MKKSLFFLLFSTLLFAKTNVIVSILPQKIFVDKIGGDKVNTTIMVKAGSSPHNYTPKPSQMINISKANIYFSMGLEFEKIWLKKFINQNNRLEVMDVSKGILKNTVREHNKIEIDPHIWVDPINVQTIAKNICTTLVSQDNDNREYYQKNLKLFLEELERLDLEIKEILKETPKGSAFMVFHPSWGYFAKRYNLKQLSVEIEGKEPKMKALVKLIRKAKREKIHAIFTQPEFSDKSAKILSNNLHINIIKASPLDGNWSENLKNLARAIGNRE